MARPSKMSASEVEDGSEQLPDLELLACFLFKMIDDGTEAALIGSEQIEVPISDIALMLCDLAKSERMKVPETPATLYMLSLMNSDRALFRAQQRPSL